jgi:hypothetical protein
MTVSFYVGAVVVLVVVVVLVYAIKMQRNNPEKRLVWCMLHAILEPVRALKLGPYGSEITVENAMRQAVKKTKLTDFGDLAFAENYSVVINSKQQQNLVYNNLGYISASEELNLMMIRRLEFVNFCKVYPAFLNIPVRSPCFVVGLPRTGTTYLHRLLSLDPKVRSPLLWELLQPTPDFIPDPTTDVKALMEKDKKKRANNIKALLMLRESLGDDALKHIHEIGYDLPEECNFAMAFEMPVIPQYIYAGYLNQSEYFGKNRGINEQKVVQGYLTYKKILQLLSLQEGDGGKDPRRWVVKCPIHLYYIKELGIAFPDAKLIWCHRHPVSAVPSMCSLLKSLHQMYYTPTSRDDATSGRVFADMSAQMLAKAPQDIKDAKLEHVDVIYDDFIKDPMSVVKMVYANFGWEFTEEYKKILCAEIAKDTVKRQALKTQRTGNENTGNTLHEYAPEEFSLTTEELSSGVFADYAERFKVPLPASRK